MPIEGNVPGRFYIDESCVKCNACLRFAPKFFRSGKTQNYVSKQPENGELENFMTAYIACPTSALRDSEASY